MRTARVFTHYRCNQGCGYCIHRRPADDPREIAFEAVEARIETALRAVPDELILTGGEPTMRRDLEALVSAAVRLGAPRVVIETNAALVDAPRAMSLRSAGLAAVVVNLVGADVRVDEVTRDPGGFEATLVGIDAFLAAGLEVRVHAALVTSTVALLPELPAMLVERFTGRVKGIRLTVPVESPDPAALLSYDDVAVAVEVLADACRVVALPISFAPDASPPPCVFPRPGRVAHLYALTAGGTTRPGMRRVDACADCVLVDRCAGFAEAYTARRGVPTVRPIAEDRVRRRLSLISTVEEQIAREMVTHDRYGTAATGVIEEDLVRVNFHCNQSCRFCFVSTHLPAPNMDAVRAAIVEAAEAGRRVTLSGGEPTLNPAIVELVAFTHARSRHPVRLQTNAVRLADRGLTAALVGAGMSEAFVSLHGATASTSDAITHAPGTYEKTVRGIDALVEHGVRVILNFVLCDSNLEELVPFVRLAGGRWPGVPVNVSFVAPSTDVVPRDPEFVPRYTRAMPHLADALGVASQLGVDLVGFESMCGIPLCLVPTELSRYGDVLEHGVSYSRGEFVSAPACESCDLRGRCYGVRRGYADLHGVDELRSVRLADGGRPA